jgi:nucleoside transporter
MVFLHYFVWGAWYVTMGTYTTKTLGFTGSQVGLVYGSTAVGALVSPFLVGIIADRFFATQRILAFLHLVGAGLLYWVSTLHEFGSFYPVLLAYTISYMAGHGLTSTLGLHHSKNPAKEFPVVMVMASVGWIVAGVVVSWLRLEDNVGMFRLASGAALIMGLYSLSLPHTPPKGAGKPVSLGTLLGFDALKLMRDRSFATFMACSFLICVPLSFYFSWMNVFMNEMSIPNAAAKMTLGQVSDVIFLLLLPALLLRVGAERGPGRRRALAALQQGWPGSVQGVCVPAWQLMPSYRNPARTFAGHAARGRGRGRGSVRVREASRVRRCPLPTPPPAKPGEGAVHPLP